uniref:Ig-like domain-containing protein n=1 Tax=Podarcis muralis TaxID=64176 RepID=A0A670HZU5_PODMU
MMSDTITLNINEPAPVFKIREVSKTVETAMSVNKCSLETEESALAEVTETETEIAEPPDKLVRPLPKYLEPYGFYRLHVCKVSISDAGTYKCVAENKAGIVETVCYLSVDPTVDIFSDETELKSAVNKKIHLECQVDEDRKVTVSWSKDGTRIPPGKDYKICFEDKIASLDIPLSKLKDSGTYACTAVNEAGSSSSSATVTIRGKEIVGLLNLVPFMSSYL